MTTPGDLNQIFKGNIKNPVAADRLDVYDPGYLVIAGSKIEAANLAAWLIH